MFAVLLACATAPGHSLPDDKATDEEFAKLQGTWRLVSIEDRRGTFAAKDAPAGADLSGFSLQVKGQSLTVGAGAEADTATITIDPTGSPKLIDLHYTTAKFTLETIYEVDGDTLRICFRRGRGDAKNRPTAFSVKDNPEYEIRTYTRQK